MFKKITPILAFFSLFIFSSCSSDNEISKTYMYFNTAISVKIGGNYSDDELENICDDINDTLSYYDKITSKRNNYSSQDIVNIYTINDNPSETHYLSDELYNIIDLSVKMHSETNNTFNIALDPVVSIWEIPLGNFNLETGEKLDVPDSNLISDALNFTDINRIKLSENDKTITMSDNMSLNLGGMAKGYAIAMVGNMLKDDSNIKYFIIDAGGSSLSVYGDNPSKYRDNWIIGVEDPVQNDMLSNSCYQCYYTDISLPSGYTVSTSGDYQKYFIGKDDKKYHHIIDPTTGYPVETNVKSVTVITDNSIDADIISTALFIMPIEDAREYVDSKDNIEAIWYLNNDDIIRSKNFSKFEI